MENGSKMKALFIIINAGYANEVVSLLREAGAKGATILNSRGEGVQHEYFMGITVDSEKELIVCVVEETTAEKAMIMMKERKGVQPHVRSVCFTMPIDTVVGLNMPFLNPADDKE
ncbi:P-II family nitrogen regulator [Lutispora thermophila]|uniref:Nitrogen regulatory protein P-II family n=1 Tax=Lutispora thermophila DSM 19022 TaxID=1122184 RepID=A0A1M6CGT7_9FIRM|nr:P-II family nitrogen regulator [Lutispora thermophila]SHI60061.1 nitrogen regulatory protein P-II family [Lutispora thermophila DSM 19022]